jgi:AraC-like DNA-binding protein
MARIADLESLAVRACYSGPVLADLCGVSLRQLQRHVQASYFRPLGEWLNAMRLRHAYRRLSDGCLVKEAAFSLGYKQVSHFSRNFKDHYGFCPSLVPITALGGDVDGADQMQLSLFDRG